MKRSHETTENLQAGQSSSGNSGITETILRLYTLNRLRTSLPHFSPRYRQNRECYEQRLMEGIPAEVQEMYLKHIRSFVDRNIRSSSLHRCRETAARSTGTAKAALDRIWGVLFHNGVRWQQVFALLESVIALVALDTNSFSLIDDLIEYFNTKVVVASGETVNQWIEANGGWMVGLQKGKGEAQETSNREGSSKSQSEAGNSKELVKPSPQTSSRDKTEVSQEVRKKGEYTSADSKQKGKAKTEHNRDGSSSKGKGKALVLAPHPRASQPNEVYNEMVSKGFCVRKVRTINPNVKQNKNNLRIVCISDTHNKTDSLVLPDGDILIHAGDFTMKGECEQVIKFAKFLQSQPHKHKIVIAGNHELSFAYFDGQMSHSEYESKAGILVARKTISEFEALNVQHPKDLLPKDVIFLNDSSATVCGLNIYGSPWTPYHIGWAYNAHRGGDILQKWNQIPAESDIVITHGPPVGVGDLTFRNIRAGCVDLLSAITSRVRPKIHVFGHIHEGYGQYTIDGSTQFINASTCTQRYVPSNRPICIDIS